jgi:hypothetical protein
VTVFLLKWTDQDLLALVSRVLPEADLTRVVPALYGSLTGLAIGALLVVVVGRSGESLCGLLVIGAACGIYGAVADPGDAGVMLPILNPAANGAVLILGALGGILAGAIRGALIGVIIKVSSS